MAMDAELGELHTPESPDFPTLLHRINEVEGQRESDIRAAEANAERELSHLAVDYGVPIEVIGSLREHLPAINQTVELIWRGRYAEVAGKPVTLDKGGAIHASALIRATLIAAQAYKLTIPLSIKIHNMTVHLSIRPNLTPEAALDEYARASAAESERIRNIVEGSRA